MSQKSIFLLVFFLNFSNCLVVSHIPTGCILCPCSLVVNIMATLHEGLFGLKYTMVTSVQMTWYFTYRRHDNLCTPHGNFLGPWYFDMIFMHRGPHNLRSTTMLTFDFEEKTLKHNSSDNFHVSLWKFYAWQTCYLTFKHHGIFHPREKVFETFTGNFCVKLSYFPMLKLSCCNLLVL